MLKYIKHFCLKSICLFLIVGCNHAQTDVQQTEPVNVQEEKQILPGAFQVENYIQKIKTVSVGIVANPTSVIAQTHLVDSLLSLGVDVRAVFSPEHGFRGNADAGAKIEDSKDAKTGVPIFSLYGKHKKPTAEQLKDLDVLVFDLQDVGVRFYTYISTLHYVMEAAAEHNTPLIVLDRPNPNGHIVDGPVLEKEFTSFVGMHRVPILYGMTIGEYARMINGEFWLKDSLHCDLTVVKNKNYTHSSEYSLPISPSPNLQSDQAINLYPSLCLLEGTVVSVGRGTVQAFEIYGHPDFENTNYSFTPKPGKGSSSPKLNGQKCNGFNLEKHDRLGEFSLDFLFEVRKQLKGKDWINRKKFFNLLAGNSELQKQLLSGASETEIRQSWEGNLSAFKKMRERYLLYF